MASTQAALADHVAALVPADPGVVWRTEKATDRWILRNISSTTAATNVHIDFGGSNAKLLRPGSLAKVGPGQSVGFLAPRTSLGRPHVPDELVVSCDQHDPMPVPLIR